MSGWTAGRYDDLDALSGLRGLAADAGHRMTFRRPFVCDCGALDEETEWGTGVYEHMLSMDLELVFPDDVQLAVAGALLADSMRRVPVAEGTPLSLADLRTLVLGVLT